MIYIYFIHAQELKNQIAVKRRKGGGGGGGCSYDLGHRLLHTKGREGLAIGLVGKATSKLVIDM